MIIAAVALAYAPSFRGTWVYDDIPAILENPTLKHLASSLTPPAEGGLPVAGRPLVNVSLAVDYAISGTNPWSYHLTNLLIHGVSALLLFGLVRRTIARQLATSIEAGQRATLAATLVAVLWAVHPLTTEAVAYVVQRAESLMACFYLLTLYAFVRAVDRPTGRPAEYQAARPSGNRPWLALCLVACAAGMASKEVMVSAPAIVLLYDRTYVSGTFAHTWRRRRSFYLLLAATWIILAALVGPNATRGGTAGFGETATAWTYAGAQARAHVLYLWLTAWPQRLVFDYGVDTLPLAHWDLPCAAVVVALVALTLYGFVKRTAWSFPAAVYFALLAPSSSFLPIVTEPIAEHRMYLPSALALVLAVMFAVVALGRRSVLPAVVAAIALATLTVHREGVYASEWTLWTDTVAKMPESARAHYNLARLLFDRGDIAGAIAHYRTAIGLRPDFPSAHNNLSNALLQQGDVAGAGREAQRALQSQPNFAAAHNNLGDARLVSGDVQGALAEYENAVRLEPANPEFRNNRATALSNLNQLIPALRDYDFALQARPDSPLFHFNRANTLARLGRFKDAIPDYETTLRLDPNYPRAAQNLARVRELLQRAP